MIFATGIPLIYPNDEAFKDCFSPDYNFICTDPDNFFQRMGIDIKKNIVQFKQLHKIDNTKQGCHKGSFYVDKESTEYFVKKCQILNEFLGSKLINLFLDKNTAIVKVVEDQKSTTASLKIPNFIRQKELKDLSIKIKKSNVIDTARLTVAMDFIALTDRSKRNMGFITSLPNILRSARVDYDDSFHFGKKRWKGEGINSDHLNLNLLKASIKKFPKDEIIDAIKNIITVSDKDLMMTVLECWITLQHVGLDLPIETGFLFGKQIIERKNAFHEVLNELISSPSESKKSQSSNNKSVNNEIPKEAPKPNKVKPAKPAKIKKIAPISPIDSPKKKSEKNIPKSA